MSRSAAKIARDLRIPFSRIYNALGAIGLDSKKEIDHSAALQLIVEIQQSAIPFTALAVELGEDTTLADLARIEITTVQEKYKLLWEKRSQTPKKKESYVDFTNLDVGES